MEDKEPEPAKSVDIEERLEVIGTNIDKLVDELHKIGDDDSFLDPLFVRIDKLERTLEDWVKLLIVIGVGLAIIMLALTFIVAVWVMGLN